MEARAGGEPGEREEVSRLIDEKIELGARLRSGQYTDPFLLNQLCAAESCVVYTYVYAAKYIKKPGFI